MLLVMLFSRFLSCIRAPCVYQECMYTAKANLVVDKKKSGPRGCARYHLTFFTFRPYKSFQEVLASAIFWRKAVVAGVSPLLPPGTVTCLIFYRAPSITACARRFSSNVTHHHALLALFPIRTSDCFVLYSYQVRTWYYFCCWLFFVVIFFSPSHSNQESIICLILKGGVDPSLLSGEITLVLQQYYGGP